MDIREKAELKQKFNEKFFKHKDAIVKFENLRKKWKKKRTIRISLAYTIGILLALGLLLLLISSSSSQIKQWTIFDIIMPYVCFGCAIFAIFVFLIQYFDKDNYKKKFSETIKNECFDDLLSVFDFIKKGHEPSYSLEATGLVSSSVSGKTNIEIDDEFYGCYNNVKFRITELSNGMIRGKQGVYTGPWKGIVLNLVFNKYSAAKIDVIPQANAGVMVMIIAGIAGCILSYITSSALAFIFCIIWTLLVIWSVICSPFKKVNLEDESFDKKFFVQAEDQIEARYVLTPAFMERLNNLKTVYNAKKVWCKFDGYNITLAFETKKDLFEIGNLDISTTKPEQVEQFYQEIMAVVDIIDHFKLNERTGL